ncbi:MAG: HEAT repeat domain-containing protein [Cyanobacteria bacterium J083]|nr:MAG: HEAT repeat domain-containing protein [Cyanobacteria bacterium J083]
MLDVQSLIKAVEKADSAQGLLDAVEDLAAVKSAAAIPTLVKVLGFNNPGAAVAAVEGLVNIGEPAVPYILDNLDDYNYGARAWSIRALAGIGDPMALDLLLRAVNGDFSQSVRRAAARGLGNILWHKLPPQEVLSKQQIVLEALLLATEDGEWVVRYAAIVGLQGLYVSLQGSHRLVESVLGSVPKAIENIEAQRLRPAGENFEHLTAQILHKLQNLQVSDVEISVRARALWALKNLINEKG